MISPLESWQQLIRWNNDMTPSKFDKLVAATYRCPGDDAAWLQLARDVAAALQAVHAHIVVLRNDGTIGADVATEPEAGLRYVRDYAHRDLASVRVLAQPLGSVAWSHELLSVRELMECPVQNELLPPIGVTSRSWILTRSAQGIGFGTALLHGAGVDGLDPLQRRWLQRLQAHLHQAMDLHVALVSARQAKLALEAGMEALPKGVLLLDAGGQVLFANSRARRHFNSGGLGLVGGRLVGASPSEDVEIRRLVTTATARPGPPRGGSLALSGCRLQAVPVGEPGMTLAVAASAVLLVHDTAQKPINSASLLPLGLTPAEAKLAAALAEGETLDNYALRTGRARGTARSQLRSVFEKTGTHRQSELLLLVHRHATPD